MKAKLKNYNQSPRKVRLLANFLKGKSVKDALAELNLLNKKASKPVEKLLKSAVANAKNNNNSAEEDLVVKNVRVDKGVVQSRFRAGAHGRAYPLRRRRSHVAVELGAQQKKQEARDKAQAVKSERNTKVKTEK